MGEPLNRATAYGRAVRDCFGAPQGPRFEAVTLGAAEISATRVHCDIPDNGMTDPLPLDDAWLVTVHLRDCARHDLWLDGVAQPTGPLAAGMTSAYDLRRDPRVNSVSTFTNVHFYIPRAALKAIALRDGNTVMDELPHRPGLGMEDPVIGGLALALQPAFERPAEASRLFLDHVTRALAGHVAGVFGRRTAREGHEHGLTAAQCRRAGEMLDAQLNGAISLSELAEAFDLSCRQFVAAFAASTGLAPHRWLIRRRLEKAVDLLRNSDLSASEVASACGFADEAHLRRVLWSGLRASVSTIRH